MQILIGACGWQHEQWQGQFYPDDLPLDWRLPYYTNEFETLLVPYEMWSESELEEIESWLDDIPEIFDLFFEVDLGLCNENVKKMLSHEIFRYRQVKFTSKSPVQCLEKCNMQHGAIVNNVSTDEKIALIRCSSQNVIKPDEIRQLIEKAKDDYRECDNVFLFFDQALLDMNILNNAKIIVDLLSTD